MGFAAELSSALLEELREEDGAFPQAVRAVAESKIKVDLSFMVFPSLGRLPLQPAFLTQKTLIFVTSSNHGKAIRNLIELGNDVN